MTKKFKLHLSLDVSNSKKSMILTVYIVIVRAQNTILAKNATRTKNFTNLEEIVLSLGIEKHEWD